MMSDSPSPLRSATATRTPPIAATDPPPPPVNRLDGVPPADPAPGWNNPPVPCDWAPPGGVPPVGCSSLGTLNSRKSAVLRPSKTRTVENPVPVPTTMSASPSVRNWPTATFTPPRRFGSKAKNARSGAGVWMPICRAFFTRTPSNTLTAGPPPAKVPVTM